MRIHVGYAQLGSPQMRGLRRKQATKLLVVDFSFNESIPDDEIVILASGGELRVYGLLTLVAEKYRALLQQVVRKRNRRQDVFDLDFLLRAYPGLRDPDTLQIVRQFVELKCQEREIQISEDSFDDPEIKRMAQQDYDTLQVELSSGDFREFDITWTNVANYFAELFS